MPGENWRTTDAYGYVYDEDKGAPQEGYPAGTTWNALPEDWPCPVCAVREKPDFTPVAPKPD